MAELQASYIQASSHPADTDRLVLEGLMNPAGVPVSGAAYGVGQGSTELKVQAKGTPNMSVDVLAGHGWIDGTEGANQGTYHVYNDATKNLVISAAHATLPRKDLVVAKVQDAAYSGAVNAWSLAVVTGTPASPALEPAVPANAVVLALVDVAALAASIINANITDRRRRASALGGVVVCTSATRPAAPYVGEDIFETDTKKAYFWNGTDWAPHGAGGELGYAEVTANQGTFTAETDLTGITKAVTVATARRIKIHVSVLIGSSIANDRISVRIKEGATQLGERTTSPSLANNPDGIEVFAYISPTAGAHTYKATAVRLVGTGNLTSFAGAGFPAFIEIEDIGPA